MNAGAEDRRSSAFQCTTYYSLAAFSESAGESISNANLSFLHLTQHFRSAFGTAGWPVTATRRAGPVHRRGGSLNRPHRPGRSAGSGGARAALALASLRPPPQGFTASGERLRLSAGIRVSAQAHGPSPSPTVTVSEPFQNPDENVALSAK